MISEPVGLVSKALPAIYRHLRLFTPFWVNNRG